MIALEQSGMSKKKDRAFFICPRWNEVADTSRLCGVGHDDADPWQREKPDRDQGGAARRSIDAPQGIAGRAPGVGVDVRRRCLYRGPAHRSIAVNRGGHTGRICGDDRNFGCRPLHLHAPRESVVASYPLNWPARLGDSGRITASIL